ncbi:MULTISPECIES: hypothetical protein [Dehalobacter]|uniref:hypothetical protein n=1 Tax=Dehalobacter TaxID=56112 RepID=UPI00258FCD2F|nr:hypothetical protein [Dehalobacter sp.]MDJ0305384.1 hypothetical protein [Dehalobacter sp.]
MLVPLPDVLFGVVEFKNERLVFKDGYSATEEQKNALDKFNKALETETVIIEA